MAIYGISDLHLYLDNPEKTMNVFGNHWNDHINRLRDNWKSVVSDDDVVVIAGDVSWALKFKEDFADLDFVKSLPGKKVLVRGNHDYWWRRDITNRIQKTLPDNMFLLQGSACSIDGVWFAGTRGWRVEEGNQEGSLKIFKRELAYFERALSAIPEDAFKIAVLHYPPFDEDLKHNVFAKCARNYKVDMLVYGHIHGGQYLEGNINGVEYVYIAADHLDFMPKLIKR